MVPILVTRNWSPAWLNNFPRAHRFGKNLGSTPQPVLLATALPFSRFTSRFVLSLFPHLLGRESQRR